MHVCMFLFLPHPVVRSEAESEVAKPQRKEKKGGEDLGGGSDGNKKVFFVPHPSKKRETQKFCTKNVI